MADPFFPASEHRIWNWKRHPAFAGKDLTLGQRAADRMRASMGSWPFVFLFLTAMALWAISNSIFWIGGAHGFDKYPYILLNLLLSTLAGLQGAILLIAAKRSDEIASAVAMHTLEESIKSDAKLDAICLKLGITVPDEASMEATR